MILTCGTCGHRGEDGKDYNHDCYWVFRERGLTTKRQMKEAQRAEKEAQGKTVHSTPDVRPVVGTRRDALADAIAHVLGPDARDDDIPIETRRELMHCATQNGRISYWYLCDIWRRGKRAGKRAQIEGVIQRVAELPDRTSPDDWPEAMLVTADELRAILTEGQ